MLFYLQQNISFGGHHRLYSVVVSLDFLHRETLLGDGVAHLLVGVGAALDHEAEHGFKIAKSFGEECHEVPIGFKYISAGIDQYDAVLGGESSGGLTVRGHIHGKDSIYAASLFVEMVCAMGSPTKMIRELEERFGTFEMVEANLEFPAARKPEIQKTLMVDKKLPEFDAKVVRVNYEDGCKVYFEDGFVICRFSGTEPLLRIFAESTNPVRAKEYIDTFKKFLFE